MSTLNNNLAARSYQLQFKQMLQAVFRKRSYFGDFFNGGIDVLDGVRENENAFYVKTSDIPVVIGSEYLTQAYVAFDGGTANSTRFGDRKEIIYTNTPVPYTWGWNIHEGIDRHTVNNDFDVAIADRLELQAQAKTQLFNKQHSEFIAKTAARTMQLATYDADDVLTLFNWLAAHYVNIEGNGTKVAKVNTSLYNAIVDHPLVTTAKQSGVNIDSNNILKFKDFQIQPVPDSIFYSIGSAPPCAYTYITNVGKAFTGINTARVFESEDFDGVALQGAGKAGEFILDDNKKAVVKVEYAGA